MFNPLDYIWVQANSGRLYTRNKEGTGVIMQWKQNGTTKYTIIFDAKYRTKLALSNDIHSWVQCDAPPFIKNYTIKDKDLSDEILDQNDYWCKDQRSNREATDNILKLYPKSPAALYCRNNIKLNKDGVDIPTIPCICRIWCDSRCIDALDPTIKDYPEYSLEQWFPCKNDKQSLGVWSSSLNYIRNPIEYNYSKWIASMGILDIGLPKAIIPVLDIL